MKAINEEHKYICLIILKCIVCKIIQHRALFKNYTKTSNECPKFLNFLEIENIFIKYS